MSRAECLELVSPSYRRVICAKFHDEDPELIDRRIDEVTKYLWLVSGYRSGRFIPLTRSGDEVWHEMIVQTRQYARLCENLPGSKFIHHESVGMDDYAKTIGQRRAVVDFLSWVPDYVAEFGDFTEESAREWAVVEFLRRAVGLSLQEINRLEHASSRSAS